MISTPGWLPPTLDLSGTWEHMLSTLYGIFEKDFKQTKPQFQNHPIWWDNRVLPGQRYEEGFWHLISRDEKVIGERIPDFRRAERLPWCAPILINSGEPAVKVWDYRENGGRIRTYVWLELHDYCAILERITRHNHTAALLVTAFHVDGPSQRRNLRTKFEKRVL